VRRRSPVPRREVKLVRNWRKVNKRERTEGNGPLHSEGNLQEKDRKPIDGTGLLKLKKMGGNKRLLKEKKVSGVQMKKVV